MNVIIDYKDTRRQIDGPFVIQGEAIHLQKIADAILNEIKKKGDDARLWVLVGEPPQKIHFNRPGVPWEQANA